MERACKGNADDMGETCECGASDGSSRLTELLVPGATATFGVAGVPLDEDILPMYHDCNQSSEGHGGSQKIRMSYVWSMNAPEPSHDLRHPPSQPARENKQINGAPGGNDPTYDQ